MNAQAPKDGTVGKALEILDAVAAYERPVRFSELLEQSRYPKATLYRMLQTLTNQRMLAFDPADGTYTLGARLMRLAHTAWKTASLAPIARPFLEPLALDVGESVHLAQLDNGQVLFIDKIRSNTPYETLARVGQVAPAYCTGVGKAMLAFLAPKRLELALQQQAWMKYTPNTHDSAESLMREIGDIRQQGIAFDREEHQRGIISIAAPILSSNGRVIGAMSIATSTTRYSLDGLLVHRASLLETAEKIGAEATSWQFPA